MVQATISITQGDTAVFNLTAVDGDLNPVDLTGATFVTLINEQNGSNQLILPNSQHVANPDQINFMGQFTLSLNSSDTAACGLGNHKEIITQITIGATIVTFRGPNTLEVLPPIPLQ